MASRRYVWVVIVEGSSEGQYENNANAVLFPSYEEAKKFVESDIDECIIKDKVVSPMHFTDREMEDARAEKSEWFSEYEARYTDCGSVTDWRIYRSAIPEKKAKKTARRKK